MKSQSQEQMDEFEKVKIDRTSPNRKLMKNSINSHKRTIHTPDININICKSPPKLCKFCLSEITEEDILHYDHIGFCCQACFLMDLNHRLAKLESKLNNGN